MKPGNTPDSQIRENGKERLAVPSFFSESEEGNTSDSEKREGIPTLKGRLNPPPSRVGKGVNASPSHTPPGRGHNPASDSEKKKDAIEFFWQGVPPRSTAQTRRHTRAGQTYRTPGNRRSVATLRAVCEKYAPRIAFAGPVSLEAAMTFQSRRSAVLPRTSRPDADNLAKDLLDALQATGYFKDDSQVACLIMRKFDGPIPGIFVRVSNLP